MKPELLWSGLFQGAFKHQVLVAGVDDVYYLKRADFQLPQPPLPTLEIAPEIIPDLREVYGIAADGTLYVNGPVDAEGLVGDRTVRTFAQVSFGDADAAVSALEHELGNPFYGAMALSPAGQIFVVSNVPDFKVVDAHGAAAGHAGLPTGAGDFERPVDRPGFWETGAGAIACGPTSFLVGAHPLDRVDRYGYDGRLLGSLRAFRFDGKDYDFGQTMVSKLAFGPQGTLLVSTARHLFIFDATGAIKGVVTTAEVDMGGGSPGFHLWMAVDAQGRLWTQYYKGKEVAYAAFALPLASA